MEGERGGIRKRCAPADRSYKEDRGNTLDPISGGRLCARGQAAVQGLYHPDRLRGPMKRAGDRGSAQFTPVSWDDAMSAVAAKITGDAVNLIFNRPKQRFPFASYRAFSASPAPPAAISSVSDFAVERWAAEAAFGWKGLPVYDIANARHVLSVGADFLGGWTSPVSTRASSAISARAGPGFAEASCTPNRGSLTASSADRWLPVRPGMEVNPHGRRDPAGYYSGRRCPRHAFALPRRRDMSVRPSMNWPRPKPLIVAGASVVRSNSRRRGAPLSLP